MNADRVLERLRRYEAELKTIHSRFNHTHSGIHIADGDDSRLHKIVLELRDLFDDALGKNTYSKMVVGAFNEGVSNFTGSPSLHCVERITGIISAGITRLEENPSVLSQGTPPEVPEPMEAQQELSLPATITLHWLYSNVPYKFWLSLAAVLAAVFGIGVTVVINVPIVQQWMGVICQPTP